MQNLKTKYIKQLGLNVGVNSINLIDQMIFEHQTRFTFNNLDILLSKLDIISLEIEDLFDKILIKKRGGYCFEHNKLFIICWSNWVLKCCRVWRGWFMVVIKTCLKLTV